MSKLSIDSSSQNNLTHVRSNMIIQKKPSLNHSRDHMQRHFHKENPNDSSSRVEWEESVDEKLHEI